MSKDMPLISVVVPVYGTEKYLRKCLDSILNQTYKNIEVIVVNDATKDNSEEIIKEYLENYDNIKYVKHKENKGLFQARISGADEATGKYIAFVDSDDYISCDFYRLLVRKAIETNSDMVVGNFYLEQENGVKEYFNLDPFHIDEFELNGDEVLKTYMEQEGLCYSYQLVWNKLYKKELWDKGVKFFKEFASENVGLIMTEDIGFSSFFWTNSRKVANTMNAVYYYCQRPGQSTDNKTQNKLKQHLKDTISVFEFFKKMLVDTCNFEKYEKNYQNWRKLYGRINFDNFKRLGLLEENLYEIKHSLFMDDKMCGLTFEDGYYYSIKTPAADSETWYENIKLAIYDSATEYVSFDIFDTVVLRPFWLPTDLFYLMNEYFMNLTGASSDIDFAQIRIESERYCRKEINLVNPGFDDITLREIYRTMNNRYCISEEICNKLLNKEIELEIRFCTTRKSGKELYQLALDTGKKILFTSDMYLEKDTIEKILAKNGYTDYHKLYLSSDLRCGKWSGNIYKYILKDLEIKNPLSVLHIGDNWDSDVEMPRKYGIRSQHLDKTINIFANRNQGIFAGDAFNQSFVNNATGRDLNGGIWGFMGLRTMLAVVANKYFDNPYVSFNRATDFNANPSFIGYFALGMHVFGVASWLIEKIKNKKSNKIHFVARDGYIIKMVYDMLNSKNELPESNYLYLSRKALAFADVMSPVDMYSLINKLNIKNTSPKKFILMFKDMINKDRLDDIIDHLQDNGILPDRRFANREEYERFVFYFINNIWNDIDWTNYRANLKEYFSDIINEGDVLFDIGYSGRSESALHSILGYTLDSYYIHSNSEVLDRRKKAKNFNNELFYYYKPYITGVMREHMFMKLAPSTIGYSRNNQEMVPVFEEYIIDSVTKIITEKVQKSAVQFTADMISIFGDELNLLYARKEDVSQPFEYYLHYSKKLDRNIFSTLVFEDDFGEGKKLRAVDFWSSEIRRMYDMQKNLILTDRIVKENEQIGAKKIEYYNEEENKLKCINKKYAKTAIFIDEISESDSTSIKYDKCAGNSGNIIEWDAIKKLVSPSILKNWYMTHQGGFEENDYDVFLTTNLIWIEENMDLTYLDKVLERIGRDKILLPISVGFTSSKEKKDFNLSKESIKTLSAIAERCKSVGVRGEYSCEILNNFGIKNTRIIGYPAMYANRSIIKQIKNDAKELKSVCSSFKPFYGTYSEKEQSLLKFFADNKCSFTDTTNLNLKENSFTDKNSFKNVYSLQEKKKVFFDIDSWKKSFEKVDFSIGMNLYNNLMSIGCGVPAMFVTYETIGREICKLYNLPVIDISEFDSGKSMMDYYMSSDYSGFCKVIDSRYKEFSDFLKENNVKVKDVEDRIIYK